MIVDAWKWGYFTLTLVLASSSYPPFRLHFQPPFCVISNAPTNFLQFPTLNHRGRSPFIPANRLYLRPDYSGRRFVPSRASGSPLLPRVGSFKNSCFVVRHGAFGANNEARFFRRKRSFFRRTLSGEKLDFGHLSAAQGAVDFGVAGLIDWCGWEAGRFAKLQGCSR